MKKKDWMTDKEVIAAKKLVQKYNMIFAKNDLVKQTKSSTRSS